MTTSNAAIATREYLAFISYRHADNKQQGRQWATWLHQALETYEVPADLVGKTNSRGEVIPERIYPIFRDEDELPAHADLANSITSALANSRLLVVLCSPNAVASTYVADEIRFFKQLGHSDRIIAAMIDGEPNASWDNAKQAAGVQPETECFPLPLQFTVDEQGALTTQRAEPIAADFRVNLDGKTEQGWTNVEALKQHLKTTTKLTEPQIKATVSGYQQQQQLMLLKIIAGILGVPLGELTKRDQAYQLEQQRKKAKRLRQWLSGVAVLAMLATAAGIYAWQQRVEAIAQRDKAEALLDNVRENLNFMNYDLRDVLTAYAPSDKRVEVMQRIDALSNVLQQHSTISSAEDQRQIAVALMQKADVILANAKQNPSEAIALQKQAHSIFESLAAKDPFNKMDLQSLSVSHNNLGDSYAKQGDSAAALTAYQAGMEIAKKLVTLQPSNTTFLRALSIFHENLGDSYARQGDSAAALTDYQAGMKIREKLVALDPTNTTFLRDLSRSHDNLGDSYAQQGDSSAAITAYQAGMAIREKLVALDPQNTKFLRGLSVSHNNLGKIYALQGDGAAALTAYQAGMAIAEKLVALDPQNTKFLRGLSVSHDNLGDSYALQGDSAAALTAYQAGMKIREKLVVLDPTNTILLRDLSISHNNLGDSYAQQGDGAAALTAYRAGMAIAEKLVALDPTNTIFLRDLSVFHDKLGDSYALQGDSAAALKAYHAGMATRKKLVALAPTNTTFLRALSRSHDNLGNGSIKQGDSGAAITAYQASIAIREKLVALDPTNTIFLRDLSVSHDKLGNSYAQQGDGAAALTAYQAAMETRKKLVAFDPNNNKLQNELLWSYSNIAQTYSKEKEFVLAEKAMMTGIVNAGIDVQSQHLTEQKLQLLKMRIGSYLSWSWYAIFTKKINQVPAVLERVIDYLPENKDETIELHSNLAHSYLLTGNYNSAKSIYEKYRGYKFQNGNTWDKTIIADFEALEENGVKHESFGTIAKEVFGVELDAKK